MSNSRMENKIVVCLSIGCLSVLTNGNLFPSEGVIRERKSGEKKNLRQRSCISYKLISKVINNHFCHILLVT